MLTLGMELINTGTVYSSNNPYLDLIQLLDDLLNDHRFGLIHGTVRLVGRRGRLLLEK